MAIRVGMIGAGRAGQRHLQSLATLPDVEIAAVCDSDRTLAERLAAPYGAAVHINFRSLIETEKLDVTFICTPPFAHGEPEMLAARAGIHLFVEPPVALNGQKAAQVQKEIEQAGIIAGAGYTWRCLSGTARLKERLARRRLGLIQGSHVQGVPETEWRRRRESSGGLIVQAATDILDVMRYLAGEVTTVTAMAAEGIAAATTPEYELEDACAAMVGFRSGAVGELICSVLAPEQVESRVHLWADGFAATLTPEYVEIVEAGRTLRERHESSGLNRAHKSFLEAVRAGSPERVACTYAEAAATLHVALAMQESIHTAGRVSV